MLLGAARVVVPPTEGACAGGSVYKGSSTSTRTRSPEKSELPCPHLRPTYLNRRRTITGNLDSGERAFRRRNWRLTLFYG